MATELEMVLSGERLGESIGPLVSGGDPLDFDELVLDLFPGVVEGDVDVPRAVAVVGFLLRLVYGWRIVFADDSGAGDGEPEFSSNSAQVAGFARGVGQSETYSASAVEVVTCGCLPALNETGPPQMVKTSPLLERRV